MKPITLTLLAEELGLKKHVLAYYLRKHPVPGVMAGRTRIFSAQEAHEIKTGVERRRGGR